MDLPLYTTVSRTALSDLGSSAYQLFDHAVVLDQVMRQSEEDALHLYPTIEAVAEHNVTKLRASGQTIAAVKVIHRGPNASKASPDDVAGLDPVVCIAHGAREISQHPPPHERWSSDRRRLATPHEANPCSSARFSIVLQCPSPLPHHLGCGRTRCH